MAKHGDDSKSWERVSGRKVAKERVNCSKKGGCSGSCPLRIVARNAAAGNPTVCTVCGKQYAKQYAKPANAVAMAIKAKVQPSPKYAADNKLLSEVDQLRATVKKLQGQMAAKSPPAPETAMAVDDVAEAANDHVKTLRSKVKFLKSVEEDARGIFDPQGGYTKVLADTEKQLQVATATQRGSKPLDVQKASAEAHLKKVIKLHENAKGSLEQLEQQQAEIAKKIAVQQAATAATALRVEDAKREAADISGKIAASLREDVRNDDGAASPPKWVINADEARLLQSLLQKVHQRDVSESCSSLGIRLEQALDSIKELAAKVGSLAAPSPVSSDPSTVALDFKDMQRLFASFSAEDDEEKRASQYEAALESKRARLGSKPY